MVFFGSKGKLTVCVIFETFLIKFKMSSFSETEHALYMFARTLPKYQKEPFMEIPIFCDGIPFAHMINRIDYCKPVIHEMQQSPEMWTNRLTNLKKLIAVLEGYVEGESGKRLKTSDIQLIEIAKNKSSEEVFKLFEAVMAVLMQTADKEEYIQIIMSLDTRSQEALVTIVQNAMEYRILEHQPKSILGHENPESQRMGVLINENQILTEEINDLSHENGVLLKENKELKDKLHQSSEEIERIKHMNMEIYMSQQSRIDVGEKGTIETLKSKMISLSREHEIQMAKLNDENYQLKTKYLQAKDLEEESVQKFKILEEKLRMEAQQYEGQNKKKERLLDEKEVKIRKLEYELEMSKNKIRELSEDIEVNDLNLRMELEKKEVRFKQLQKEVRSRLAEPSMDLSEKSGKQSRAEIDEEQFEFLKVEVEKLRNSNRELERENLKQKKRVEKVQSLENQKKKLEKIVLDVSRCRDSEIEMLVVSLYELRNQNFRMHQIITELKSQKV